MNSIEREEKLNKEERQIVYLSASIASGCKPCTKYHLKKTSEVGLSDIYIKKLIATAILIRNKATRSMELFATNQKSGKNIDVELQGIKNRNDILVGIAAAYSVNFPSGLKKYMNWGRNNGITNWELNEIITISRSVIDMARAHMNMITDTFGIRQPKEKKKENECCSGCN